MTAAATTVHHTRHNPYHPWTRAGPDREYPLLPTDSSTSPGIATVGLLWRPTSRLRTFRTLHRWHHTRTATLPRPSPTLRQRYHDSSVDSGLHARRAVSLCISRRAGPGGTCSVEPWRDCAPCHPLSDGGAGKRYANLILINRPDQGLLNSRRMDRRRFPTASGPSVGAPHPCRWIASGLSEAPSTRNPPCPSRPPFHLSRYSTVTTCFGGFGLRQSNRI